MSKIVAVTGCDSGFGNEAAHTLAGLGFHVIAGCYTKEGVEAFKKAKGEITGVQVDVTNDDSVKAFGEAIEAICKDHGLDGLVNNAGLAPTGYCEWAPLSDLQNAMNINVYGQIRVTKAVLPLIRKAKGRIVNVSSICGRLAFGGAPWYSCTKFAVEGWTDSLRREMSPFGVHVAIVEPGFFKTNMVNIEQYATALGKQWKELSDEQRTAYGEQTLTGYIQNIKDQVALMADPDTSKVVNAMVTALTSRFPKVRYPAGGSARFFFLPISHMPVWIADGILAAINPKYKPDGKVSKTLPVRLDMAALWLLGVPLLAYGLTRMSYSRSVAIASSSMAAWVLSWKWS